MNVTPVKTNSTSFGRFNPVRVDSRLLRGASVTSPLKLMEMKKNGVTQIIDLRNSSRVESPIEKFLCKILGIKYLNYRFSHRQNTIPNGDFFEKINNSILSNEGNTYIHCQYGRHRTGLAVAVYEKSHTSKTVPEIRQNMIENGYTEIITEGKSKKEQKYINLYDQMSDRYF